MATIADAIEYAHARGVLHRDLKPSNILLELAKDGAVGGIGAPHPRVADFGLAKWIFPGRETTTIGALVGTPRYIAPEQLGGGRPSAGPRADVYSLGVILTDILVAAERSEETDKAILEGSPADLAAIARQCLEPDPLDRYGSAAEFAADLRRFLGGVPTLAGRSTLARKPGGSRCDILNPARRSRQSWWPPGLSRRGSAGSLGPSRRAGSSSPGSNARLRTSAM